MQRSTFIKNTVLSIAATAMSSKDLIAAILQQPTYKIKMLRGDVGIFTERGGTIGFYQSKEGFAVVDTQFTDTSKHLIDALKQMKDMPFKYLINTHHHGDHTGGNIAFKDLAEHVVGHENCLANYKRVAEQSKTVEKQLFQDIVFKDTWKQKLGKEKIKAHYFGNAHTNGDAIIHFQHANIAHMGDLMFNLLNPAVDRTSGASMQHWIEVLQKTKSTFDNDTLFVFGHSADPEKVTGTKNDITLFEEYLQQIIAFVSTSIKEGKTKEQIIKTTDIPGVIKRSNSPERVLTAAYDELTAKV
ncbi:MAG: MBL fold metallo-hydrolase [Sphingobacteriia bacterium]|nr:MAG: MBL fold metallo-hydrolase [Sphingobacteriia bacterium]